MFDALVFVQPAAHVDDGEEVDLLAGVREAVVLFVLVGVQVHGHQEILYQGVHQVRAAQLFLLLQRFEDLSERNDDMLIIPSPRDCSGHGQIDKHELVELLLLVLDLLRER